jgi:methionyl-tRNA formyltransferase
MSGLTAAYGEVLAGATGSEQLPELAWSVGAYVCHVADNLRIWTERLMGVALAEGDGVPGTVLDDRLTVACGSGALRLTRVQLAGRAPLDNEVFLRGHLVPAGARLGG